MALTPVSPIPQISPASRPILSGLLTPTPTSSNLGCRTISAITILPTTPVPQTTIRLLIATAPRVDHHHRLVLENHTRESDIFDKKLKRCWCDSAGYLQRDLGGTARLAPLVEYRDLEVREISRCAM